MKLVQKILLQQSEAFYYSDWYTQERWRINLNLAHFTGMQSVYFKAQVEQITTGTTFTITLYNYTDSEVIETWEITDKNVHDLVSADLKALYTTEKIIGVKMFATVGSVNVFVRDCRLEITQNTSAMNRQTETFLPVADQILSNVFSGFRDALSLNFTVPIDKFDGEVVTEFQTCVRSQVGTHTDKIRLYDKTLNEAVADSEIDFHYTDPTMIATGPITLVAGHEYQVQTVSDPQPNQFSAYLPVIKIHTSDFTKCASIPVAWMAIGYGSGGDEWVGQLLAQAFAKSNVTGDTVTYQFIQNIYYEYNSWENHGVELYNNTLSALIAGTQHYIEGGEYDIIGYVDTPTLPDSCDLIRAFYGADDVGNVAPVILLAFQEEAFTPAGIVSPDSSQPTGYHCFMQNFIKNMLAGNVPLKTPDGINRTW